MPLYTGTFNWYGEIITLETTASNEDEAFWKLTAVVGYRVGTDGYRTRNYFRSRGNSYRIKKGGEL